MSYFPPPQSAAPPVRCYEDGSCDPPGTTYNPDGTKSFPPNPAGQERDALLAGMQYGLEQRQQSPIPLRGLWGGG